MPKVKEIASKINKRYLESISDVRLRFTAKNGLTDDNYGSAKMGYDLKRLLVKELLKKITGTYRYILTELGIKICKMLLLIKEKIFSPIISGIKNTVNKKRKIFNRIEKYYYEIVNNLNKLVHDSGLFDYNRLQKYFIF